MREITLKPIAWPEIKPAERRPELPDALYTRRLEALRARMRQSGLECTLIYADREHYSNFKYFAGFEPRFEEGLLALFADVDTGDAVLLGNECFGMHVAPAKIPLKGVLCQSFSLPNQPMRHFASMRACLEQAGVRAGMRVGLVGWKLFRKEHGAQPEHLYCASAYLVDAVCEIVGASNLINTTDWLIHPGHGMRVINGADEAAYFEYGAALASDGVANLLKALEPGMTESEAARRLETRGLQLSCHPMCSAGINASMGLVSPSCYEMQIGDAFTTSLGLEGGLSCRAGYLVNARNELPDTVKDFEELVAKPYYRAVVAWYELIGTDVTGGALYDAVQALLPKEKYGWKLNPGHLCATEEWLSSPIFEGSDIPIRSGMLVQMDIIPNVPGYVSANVEDGVFIANAALREEIRARHPDLWARMQARRTFMIDQLGIALKPEVLPLSNLAARYTPYVLDRQHAYSAAK